MKKVFTICFAWLIMCCTQAQQTTGTEQQLEALSELLDEDLEDDSYLQQLVYLQRHPFNINTVTAEDLQLFKMLTPLQIQSLLAYRKLLGPFIDLHELQAVPYWDVSTIRKLLPFLTLKRGAVTSIKQQLQEGEHLLLARHSRILQQQKGYVKNVENGYAGSRDKVLLRYKYQYSNGLQYGVVAEKDAGEKAFKTFKNPFDFTSFHFLVRNRGLLKVLALGDFTINLGQGFVQWQSLAFRKSSEVLAVVRQSSVIRPYHAAGEVYFNRGAAATFQKDKLEATIFASRRKLSANVEKDMAGFESITSFNLSGLHRTRGERSERHNTLQWSYGGNLSYKTTAFKIGFNAVQHYFSMPLRRRQAPDNLYAIKGNRWANGSIDYNYTYKNVYLFGEGAIDQKGAKAFVQGALASLHAKADLALLYRNIPATYQSIYGNAFTESTLPTNENGFYTGVVLRPHPAWRLQTYADHYTFPWLRASIDAPGRGADYLVQLSYTPNKQWELYARYRLEAKAGNRRAALGVMNETIEEPRQNWRLHFSNAINEKWSFKSRIEKVWFDAKGATPENGVLIYGEGAYKPTMRLAVNMRLQYFKTDGFNSRIYVYESDVLYGYSIPFFAGKGYRMYTNVSYDLHSRLTFWLRWAQTTYYDRDAVGTALEQSSGPVRSEIKMQVRLIL